MGSFIEIDNLIFEYTPDDGSVPTRAIDDISLRIEKGTFVAVIGKNGSGKSTLAKCLNGIYQPTEGTILVNGWDTKDANNIWNVRETAAMVFQNPDNQLVSSIVEDDVAFGPENLGVEPKEIRRRVDKALADVGMTEFKDKAPHNLSGGQKQRIAIAGVIAMEPECIIFDEPTAMLDPSGRKDILNIIKELHAKGITVILITHFMEEAIEADKIVVMEKGKIILEDEPVAVFSQEDKLIGAGMKLPFAVDMAAKLRKQGVDIPAEIITTEGLVDYLCHY